MPPNPEIFKGEGIEIIFKMLQAIYEGRELGMIEKDQLQIEKWVFNGMSKVKIYNLLTFMIINLFRADITRHV